MSEEKENGFGLAWGEDAAIAAAKKAHGMKDEQLALMWEYVEAWKNGACWQHHAINVPVIIVLKEENKALQRQLYEAMKDLDEGFMFGAAYARLKNLQDAERKLTASEAARKKLREALEFYAANNHYKCFCEDELLSDEEIIRHEHIWDNLEDGAKARAALEADQNNEKIAMEGK